MSSRNVNLLVVHCSATASGKPLIRGTPGASGYRNCAQVIDAWHAERGFARKDAARQAFNPTLASIGYHFVIDITGEVFTGRGVDEIGAHAAGHNSASVGICLVGGVEREGRYTQAQWKSLASVVQWQTTEHRIPLAPPLRNGDIVWRGVCGHRDLSPDTNADGKVDMKVKLIDKIAAADFLVCISRFARSQLMKLSPEIRLMFASLIPD